MIPTIQRLATFAAVSQQSSVHTTLSWIELRAILSINMVRIVVIKLDKISAEVKDNAEMGLRTSKTLSIK